MILQAFTIVHTVISLIAIVTGFAVLLAMFSSNSANGWTKWFLTTAIATTITGFFFPFHGFTPAIGLGIVSIPVLVLAVIARYSKHLIGAWRWVYVITAILALYFNVFVGVVMSFRRVPALHALAPTQTEPPFAITQLSVLVVFVFLIVVATIRFRPMAAT